MTEIRTPPIPATHNLAELTVSELSSAIKRTLEPEMKAEAERPVAPALKTVLTDIATALTQMSSLSYTGTTVDIRKKLLDFAAAFTKTCTSPASASPTA